jgi:hypothetical protein
VNLPAGPADVERMWIQGEPLRPDAVPAWLSPDDARAYRRVGSLTTAGLSVEQREALEAAGLVLDPTGVYVADPTLEAVFAIGLYDGASPLELAPAAGVTNPVLTRDDVSDVPASYVADPFLMRGDDGWHMLFEVYNWRANKGEIGLATSRDGTRWSYEGIVLAEPFHLSYPYVLEWEGERFLVPETFQAGGVRLYRADRFPDGWSPVAELVSLPYAVDASVFRHGDRWWLFAETNADERHDTLRLYHADELLGPWREHPASPVVAGDASRARPAGRVLVERGRIVRFAQDCSRVYGESVRAIEIVELTTTSYAERELPGGPFLAGSAGGWNAGGMHHVDVQRDGARWLAAVDGWRPGGVATGGS